MYFADTNLVRQRVHDGESVTEAISSSDISDDKYLKPVLNDDALILGLFDLPEVEVESSGDKTGKTANPEEIAKRNAELEEQLSRMALQFDNYRQSVQQLLDERWGDADQAEAEAKENKGKGKEAPEEPLDPSRYYWESYAGNGKSELGSV